MAGNTKPIQASQKPAATDPVTAKPEEKKGFSLKETLDGFKENMKALENEIGEIFGKDAQGGFSAFLENIKQVFRTAFNLPDPSGKGAPVQNAGRNRDDPSDVNRAPLHGAPTDAGIRASYDIDRDPPHGTPTKDDLRASYESEPEEEASSFNDFEDREAENEDTLDDLGMGEDFVADGGINANGISLKSQFSSATAATVPLEKQTPAPAAAPGAPAPARQMAIGPAA